MERANKSHGGRDNVYLGAFLGLVFPVIGFLLYWVFIFSDAQSLTEFWDFLFENRVMSDVLSISIIANLPVFFYFLSNSKTETVKGIVGATIFYGALIIIFKFF
jgi:hypothetical protein